MLLGENMALITPKRVEHLGSWQHILVSKSVSDHVAVSSKTIDYHFPAYLYHVEPPLFGQSELPQRRPNVSPAVLAMLTAAHAQPLSPEELFHYVYAVLHTPTYRDRFVESCERSSKG